MVWGGALSRQIPSADLIAGSPQTGLREALARPAGVGSSPLSRDARASGRGKIEFLHVRSKSGAESVTNVVSGQVSMTFEATPQVMPFVTSGKLLARSL